MHRKGGIPYYMQKFRFFATVAVFLLCLSFGKPGQTAEAVNFNLTGRPTGEMPVLSAVKTDPNTVTKVLIGGDAVALRLLGEGVTVLGYTDQNKDNPARGAGLKPGDRILRVNGSAVEGNEALLEVLNGCDGNPLTVEYVRKNKEFSTKITPKRGENGALQLGIFIKDSAAGIGTLTYILPTGEYGCLGHGISDPEAEELFSVRGGEVYPAHITGVKKGVQGAPGELQGAFGNPALGNCEANRETGVFGHLDVTLLGNRKWVPIASKNEVKEGPAVIRCTVDDGGIQEYQVEIVRIYRTFSGPTKNMTIQVTDKTLLEKTGGIVQGMSGSPILQDGKLVGAITHVLINDPTQGYGIFLENMLKTPAAGARDAA